MYQPDDKDGSITLDAEIAEFEDEYVDKEPNEKGEEFFSASL